MKSKQSAIVVEKLPVVRKTRAVAVKQTDRRQETRKLLDQIKARGDQLSAEIKELIVRMS